MYYNCYLLKNRFVFVNSLNMILVKYLSITILFIYNTKNDVEKSINDWNLYNL